METEQQDADTSVQEPSTSGHENANFEKCSSVKSGIDCDQKGSCDNNETVKSVGCLMNLSRVQSIYREDVVKRKDGSMVGIVTEVAGDSDSDSDSSITDDDNDDDEDDNEDGENDGSDGNGAGDVDGRGKGNKGDDNHKRDPLPADQARIMWINDTETTENVKDVEVVDRGFLHGDYVASASNPTGQLGVVVDVNISLDLLASDGHIIKDVSSKEVKRVREFNVGDYVVLGPWLGRIDDVLDNVTVLFDDGSMCKVMKADPLRLKPISKNVVVDGSNTYYPGQRVRATSSSVLKSSRWLSGLWRAYRLEGTVTKVTVGSVFIFWIASAGYGPDSSTAPAEEQSPKNLKLLSSFAHANWQLGEWCLLPSRASSSSCPVEKSSSLSELHESVNNDDSAQPKVGCDSEVFMPEESNEDGESMDLDAVGVLDKNHENGRSHASPESSTCSSSVTKESTHETWPVHRKKIRKVVVRRDKRARKREENFERALLIVHTRTKVDVAWQDGTIELGVSSTDLMPIENPGDHEFVAEQYVVEKGSDDDNDACEVKRVGVIKSVDAKERTACVMWLKPVARPEDSREFDKEEIVSVYELEGHPDYDYCYGDVVVRLSPVDNLSYTAFPGNSREDLMQQNGLNETKRQSGHKKIGDASEDEAYMNFSDLSWVGNIIGLKNGDIQVAWADGMVSTVGPQAVYVVGRDDDESIAAGSEVSDDDGASWETVDDAENDILQDAEEELEEQNATEAANEDEETTEREESNNGRNGPLYLPLVALGYVTRLASGIFARGRKQSNLDSTGGDETSDSRELSYESSSHNSMDIDNCLQHTTAPEEGQDSGLVAEATDMLDASEPLCNVGPRQSDVHSNFEDDARSFKHFDIVKDPIDHYYLGANEQNNKGRKWLKKVQQDWLILQNNLPDGIYVRVYEDRMDLLRAVITGAYGTPYQDGLFFFDFHLPPEYPDVPPSVYYHSGGWRINPNLYEEGKVCLSLLNTWTGRGNEVWDPVSSSILQVLVSLQGLVLNAKPYFNEAGYDKQIGTAEGEKNSLSYNENTFLLNCKTMMYLMRKPPKDFEDLIKEYFRRRGYYILKACDAYMKGYLIGSLTEDASISNENNSNENNANSTSAGFKLMLAKIVPKLFSSLKDVGAQCEEFKHLEHS
ncbi:Ubiquitin-conjugating enzyme E2 [Dillenia turbinata]|uniref:E2 ubiquitin-conjugating enzyme n=1 Tax=Dillenia turbinata TaxID=194707 RepID=A0AAN8WDP7_9MAGN